ncbi:hypothetical protein [Pseudomonas sp. Z3-6]|uniref:hypothetical protein n=1 Tax=Pseudomonas sp. Z3-6 TaxID=2817411 RepID=UPI003DA7BA7F
MRITNVSLEPACVKRDESFTLVRLSKDLISVQSGKNTLSFPEPIQPHVDPALRSEKDTTTAELALSQTVAARTLLYYPGRLLVQELGEAAAILLDLIRDLKTEDQKILTRRLFVEGGLLFGKDLEAFFDALAQVRDECREPDASSTVTGLARAIAIASMGNIGALYIDAAEVAEKDALNCFHTLMIERKLPVLTEQVIRSVQAAGDFYVSGPLKKIERSRPFNELSRLNGVHNFGEKADRLIGIKSELRIPSVEWQIAHISESRVLHTIEPLVGHMSVSPVEILQTWDVLRGDSNDEQFMGIIRKNDPVHEVSRGDVSRDRLDQKLARASGAAAFLIGVGYHSALEVSETILRYMGQDLRQALESPTQDAGSLLGSGAATSLINEMLKGAAAVKIDAA